MSGQLNSEKSDSTERLHDSTLTSESFSTLRTPPHQFVSLLQASLAILSDLSRRFAISSLAESLPPSAQPFKAMPHGASHARRSLPTPMGAIPVRRCSAVRLLPEDSPEQVSQKHLAKGGAAYPR